MRMCGRPSPKWWVRPPQQPIVCLIGTVIWIPELGCRSVFLLYLVIPCVPVCACHGVRVRVRAYAWAWAFAPFQSTPPPPLVTRRSLWSVVGWDILQLYSPPPHTHTRSTTVSVLRETVLYCWLTVTACALLWPTGGGGEADHGCRGSG